MVASDDSEKAYLEAYAVARQAADAVDGLVGKLNSAGSNFDRGRWKRFDLFKAALDILKGRGLEASDVVLADAAADLSDCGPQRMSFGRLTVMFCDLVDSTVLQPLVLALRPSSVENI